MEALDRKQALSYLKELRASPEKAEGCRKALVSFVWVDTLIHHWPSKATAEILELRETFLFLKTSERSRFLKQRRIILNQLVRSLTQEEMTTASASSPSSGFSKISLHPVEGGGIDLKLKRTRFFEITFLDSGPSFFDRNIEEVKFTSVPA